MEIQAFRRRTFLYCGGATLASFVGLPLVRGGLPRAEGANSGGFRTDNEIPNRARFPHAKQPDDISCGPTCASMVLGHYGVRAGIGPLKTAAGTRWIEGAGIRIGLTFPDRLAGAFARYGVRARVTRNASLADVRKAVDQDRPPILLVRSGKETWHYIAVIGYFADAKTRQPALRVADPALGKESLFWASDIERGWIFSGSYDGGAIDLRCRVCGGSGKVNAPNPNLQCVACSGSGEVRIVIDTPFGRIRRKVGRCQLCGGSGRWRGELPRVACVLCGGSGQCDPARKLVESFKVSGRTMIVPDGRPRK